MTIMRHEVMTHRMITHVILFLLLSCSFATAQNYPAVVDHVVDGDTIKVLFPDWKNSPFYKLSVRVAGIDSPEHRKPPAKCVREQKRGVAAMVFAKTLLQPGDSVNVGYKGLDKYFRIDGSVTLPDGRDWATVMISNGFAVPYDGGKKQSWCKK